MKERELKYERTDMTSTKDRYANAVKLLCPEIDKRVKQIKVQDWSEYELRKELTGCILGSQVRFEMAQAAVDRLDEAGLFDDRVWNSNRNFENDFFDVLSVSYRFSKSRARQLNQAKMQLLNSKFSLREIVFDPGDEKNLRRGLVCMLPGLGPKQASMFMRNVSRTYDLAILDSHVARYMQIQNLFPESKYIAGGITAYERKETIVKDYANTLGYPVGYVDVAIWATMRAAKELNI